jgi:methylated-DNA-[protein]-cysteine S-methyltransferase
LNNKAILDKAQSAAMLEDTPVGPLVAVASSLGLVYMSFDGLQVFKTLIADNKDVSNGRALDIVHEAVRQVQQYFNWERREFDLPLDLEGFTDFRRKVLLETARIPYGSTASYGEIAARVHNPKASRAVGGAMAHNPMVLVVPCHRVLASDGSMHAFSSPGGIATKVKLLELEGYRIVNDRLVA